jgi:lysophospholipid acyltransferase (LPLAT)-like uncharacterized protein
MAGPSKALMVFKNSNLAGFIIEIPEIVWAFPAAIQFVLPFVLAHNDKLARAQVGHSVDASVLAPLVSRLGFNVVDVTVGSCRRPQVGLMSLA